jgi:NAD(P)-dependent dehydrogenase (short-subunit alcohol dehydrogenase family)
MTSAAPHLALVTGAGKRLGRAIALRLAKAGCDLVVHYNSSADEAAAVVGEAEAMGRRAHAIGFDQSDATSIAKGLVEIDLAFGRLPDVLVNSASVYVWDDIETVSPENLQRHFAANLYGPVLLTRNAWPHHQPA